MIKRNPITLATFFRDTYLAAHPQPAANHKVYRGLIKAFSKLLGHEATLTDFTEENLSAFCATRKDAAGTEYQMVTLWRFAFQLGLIGTPPGAHRPYSQRRQIPQQPIKPPARDREAERGCRMKPAKTTRKPAAMLLSTLANEYARERHLSPVRVTRFRTTVRKFSLLCGRPATIDDLRQENLQPLREKPKKGKKTSGRNEILELLTILWTYAAKRFPLKQIPRRVASQRAAVAAAEAAMIPVPETPLMPLRSFLEQSYFACHDLKLSSIAAFRLAVMDFGNHLGETATLADLNQPAVDQYGDRRRAEGYAPPTVQTRLALLEAVWRFAYELGATTIAPPPIVRKINPKFVTRKPKPKPKPITPVEESPQEKSRRQQQFAAIQDPLSLACFYHRAAEEMKVPKARRWNRMEAIHALSWLLGRNSTTDDLSHENLAAVKLACGMKVTASERYPKYLREVWQLAFDAGKVAVGPRPEATMKIQIVDCRRPSEGGELLLILVESYLSTRETSKAYAADLRKTIKRFGECLQRPATTGDLTREAFGAFGEFLRTYETTVNNRICTQGPGTINSRLRHLKSIWFYAADEERLCDPPPRKLKRFKTPKPILQGWSTEDFSKLLVEVDQLRSPWRERIRAALLLAWNTGLRRGDIFSLQAEQISATGELTHVQGKTGRSIRRQLWPETLAAIEAIGRPAGKTILPRSNLRWFGIYIRQCCVAAGIPEGVFKYARRGSASEVERANPGAGWKWCGHASANIFQDHYAVGRIVGDFVPEPPKPNFFPVQAATESNGGVT